MYYIKIIALTLLLAGCAASPDLDSSADKGSSASSTSTGEEIVLYRHAITLLNNKELDAAEIEFLKIIKLQPDLAGPWANLGLIYSQKQQYDNAEKYSIAAVEKNPNLAQAWNTLGYIETQRGHINKAIMHYQKAIAAKPDYALAHYNLAILYDTFMQDLTKAIDHYQRYLQITEHKDKATQDWVNELKSTLERSRS